MRREYLPKFNEICSSVIGESVGALLSKKFKDVKVISRKAPTIEQVKEALLKLSGLADWDAFLREQKAGDCDTIAKTVSRLFPKVKMVSVKVTFSENAKTKMEPQDDPDMYKCTHYLNKLNGKYLDFGKASNTYENVYVLDGIDDISSCEYSEKAEEMLADEIEEDPRQLGTSLR